MGRADTVRYVCTRDDLANIFFCPVHGYKHERAWECVEVRRCPCGNEIQRAVNKGRWPKYCSDTCRRAHGPAAKRNNRQTTVSFSPEEFEAAAAAAERAGMSIGGWCSEVVRDTLALEGEEA